MSISYPPLPSNPSRPENVGAFLRSPSGKCRESNIELLRIIAMSMILIGHFMLHGIGESAISREIYVLFTTYCVCGVNLFFLISGYFRIKASVRNVSKLIFTLFFWGCVNLLLLYSVGEYVSVSDWLSLIFFPISHSRYWFIQVYLFLMICSPLINAGIDGMSLKQLRLFILIFSLFTIYSCGIGHNLSNSNGFTFLQGVYMYCLAAYIRRDYSIIQQLNGIKCLIFAVSLLTIGAAALFLTDILSCTSYNSFINILSSALILLGFLKFNFRCRFINILASAALGCYLLQDGMFGVKYLYGHIHQLYIHESHLYAIGYLVALFVLYWFCSLVITKLISASFKFVERHLILPLSERLIRRFNLRN